MQTQPFWAAACAASAGGALTRNWVSSTLGAIVGAASPSHLPMAGASSRR